MEDKLKKEFGLISKHLILPKYEAAGCLHHISWVLSLLINLFVIKILFMS